jgi:hypothetical protein
MINSVQETALTLTSNVSNIPFSSDVVRTRSANCCGWLNHSAGSTQYQITEPGVYEIMFNTNVTSATVGITGLGIKANGELLSGTEMDYTVATANTYGNVSANRLIRVCGNGSTTITVGSIPTVEATATQIPVIKNASLIIKRIGN